MKKLFTVLFLLCITGVYFSQSGVWNPTGANAAYPRTLLKSSEIETIKSLLAAGENLTLYKGIYESAQLAIPTGTTSSDRMQKGHIAKNAAFVYLMNKKYDNGNITDLTPAESLSLETKIIYILETFNTAISRITFAQLDAYDDWQWRTKEMIDYGVAYDLLRGAGVSAASLTNSKTQLQTYAGNLYEEATRIIQPGLLNYSFFDNIKNNHALKTASALGFIAVVLNDATSSDANDQPQNWINAAMWNIDNILFNDALKQSSPDALAGYAEGPYYFRYAMENCLPFFHAMGNFLPDQSDSYTYKSITRTIANPYYDSRIDLIYNWIAKIRLPDGRIPSIEDTYSISFFPELALTGKTQYNFKRNYSRLYSPTSLSAALASTSDLRADYIAANTAIGSSIDTPFQALPLSGNLVFRSSWDSSATYMHFTAKNGAVRENARGHNQADVSSFLLYSKGQVLALDPGYISYPRRTEVGEADNHNLIMVDNSGPGIGTPLQGNDADGFIENTFDMDEMDYGEVRTTYSGANIIRRSMFVRNSYFILNDFVTSDQAHNYQWQLHGYGVENGNPDSEGQFFDNLSNSQGRWLKKGVNLQAFVLAEGGATSYQKRTDAHEFGYDQTGNHTTMLVNKDNVQNTEFVSLLYPYETTAAVVSNISGTGYSGLRIEEGTHIDVILTKRDTNSITLSKAVSGFKEDVVSNGIISFFSKDDQHNGIHAQIFIKNGTILKFGADELVKANTRIDLNMQKSTPLIYKGYVNKACTVEFFLGEATSITGTNIQAYSNMQDRKIRITFTGASTFTVNIIEPVPVELSAFNYSTADNKIILKWSTITETNNKGFEIQRSIGSEWTNIGYLEGHGSTTEVNNYSFSDDLDGISGKLKYRLKQIDLDGTFKYSQVLEVSVNNIPADYALDQNYPNPFNPVTTISYSLPQPSNVVIRIFNSLGQVIRSYNETLPAGKHVYLFNAASFSSGVYYYSIDAKSNEGEDSYKQIRKMILLK